MPRVTVPRPHSAQSGVGPWTLADAREHSGSYNARVTEPESNATGSSVDRQ
jgi:hypothetical protein